HLLLYHHVEPPISYTLFFIILRHPQRSTLFPYTTLFRSKEGQKTNKGEHIQVESWAVRDICSLLVTSRWGEWATSPKGYIYPSQDRKSTRLNSSHVEISYAVFCLKKKKKKKKKKKIKINR